MVCRTAPLHGPPFRKRKNTIIRETGKEKGGFSFISADKFSRTPLPAPFRLYPSCKHPESIYHEYTTDVGWVYDSCRISRILMVEEVFPASARKSPTIRVSANGSQNHLQTNSIHFSLEYWLYKWSSMPGGFCFQFVMVSEGYNPFS